jgi:hypothetical protein
MKEIHKYLIGAILIILIAAFVIYYVMNTKDESFTYDEEQIITAQLLAANGGFIPQMAGNMDEESQYKYRNAHGINVNAMPLPVQRLTNPLCFNDVLHSHPYTSSNKKGGSHASYSSKLKHDKFNKEETPSMKQLIKANDQLIDANEELLKLAGKDEHDKKHYEKKQKDHKKLKQQNEKYHKHGHSSSTSGNVSPMSLTISVNTPGTQSVPINIQTASGTTSASSSTLTPVATKNITTQRSITTPTYTSIYEDQVIKSPYTTCINRGYSSDYCNNMYGTAYGADSVTNKSPVSA